MKVRICLECDHQNKENAWNCEFCGDTLSIESIVDLDEYKDKNALAAKIQRLKKNKPTKSFTCTLGLDTGIVRTYGTPMPCPICDPPEVDIAWWRD